MRPAPRIAVRWTPAALIAAGLAVALALTGPAAGQDDKPPEQSAAEIKLLKAEALRRQQLWEQAIAAYQDFLKDHADHRDAPEAVYGIGVAHYSLKQHDQAIEALAKLRGKKDSVFHDRALALMGYSYAAGGKHAEAAEVLGELIRQHPDSPVADAAAVRRAQSLAAVAEASKGDEGKYRAALAAARDAAQAFLDKRYEGSRDRHDGLYLLAVLEARLGNPEGIDAAANALLAMPGKPYAANALLLLGQSLERQGKAEDAIASYRQMLEVAGPGDQPNARYSLGGALVRAGQPEAAIEHLAAAAGTPDYRYAPAAKLLLGQAQLAAGKADDARKTLAAVAKDDPARRDIARYWLARIDLDADKPDAARKVLAELVKQKDLHASVAAPAAFDLAVSAFDLGQFEQAAKEFAAFAEKHGDHPRADEARYRQAFALNRAGQHEAALKVAQPLAGKKDSPTAGPAAELTANLLMTLRRYDEADKAFAALAADAEPADAREYSLRRGQIAYLRQDWERAVSTLGPLADGADPSKDPVAKEALLQLAEAQRLAERPADAAATYAAYLKHHDDKSPEPRLKRALALLEADQPDDAVKQLAEVVRGDAKSPWVQRAMLELGSLYADRGEHEEARNLLARLADTGDAAGDLRGRALYALGWSYNDTEAFDRAAEAFARLVKQHGDHELAEDALYQQAAALNRAGQPEPAILAARQYLQAHPQGEHGDAARGLLGSIAVRAGNPDDALAQNLDLVKKKETRTARALYDLAWAYRQVDPPQPDKAIEAYRSLVKEFPQSSFVPAGRQELAQLLLEQGQAEAALAELNAVKDAEAEDLKRNVAYLTAYALQDLGRHKDAAEAYARFAQTYKDHPRAADALMAAGEASVAAGDYAAAEKHFAALVTGYPGYELLPNAVLRHGQVLNELKRYDDAEKQLGRYLRFDLDKFDAVEDDYRHLARYGVGWAKHQRGRYDEAREWYTRVTDHHVGETSAKAQFQIGQTYFAQKDYPRAIGELAPIGDQFEGEAAERWAALGLYEAGRAALAAEDPATARRLWTKLIETYPDTEPAASAKPKLAALPKE